MGKVWKLPPLPKLVKEVPKIDFQSGSEGSDVSFKVTGASALIANIMKLGPVAIDAAGVELSQIGHEIIEDAKENYVPFLTGALKDSGDSDEYVPNRGIDLVLIAIWFGGVVGPEALEHGVRSAQAYALIQHEDVTFHHEFGGPKYLERPFDQMAPKIPARLAKAVSDAYGGNVNLETTLEDGAE